MNWNGISGLLCGCAIASLVLIVSALELGNDYNHGLVYCTQQGGAPYCKNKTANSALVGYSFAQGIKANDGDALLCNLTQHNNWYFTWDRRGYGWHNEKTYSYDNCQAGRQA